MNLNTMSVANLRDADDLRLAAAKRTKPQRGNSLIIGDNVILARSQVKKANLDGNLLANTGEKLNLGSSSKINKLPILDMRKSSSSTKLHDITVMPSEQQQQANKSQLGGNFLTNSFVCQRLSTIHCSSQQVRATNEHKSVTFPLTPRKATKRFGSRHSSSFGARASPSTSLLSLLFSPASSSFLSSSAFIMSVLSIVIMLFIGQMPLQANGIKLQPEGKEKFYWSGETFVITCQNNNNIKNVKIRWLGPSGAYITEDRSQRVHAESSGPHGHRLVVMNATVGADEGQYKCTIGSTDDRSPREISGFQLRLFQSASFKDTPRHLVLPMGLSGSLNCKVEFDPNVSSASVQWMRDQRPIELFNDSSIQVQDYDPGRQLSQLIISPIRRDHEARYTCRALAVTSELSKVSDLELEVEINYAPQFELPLQQVVWVESGQSMASRSSNLAPAGQLQQLGHKNVFGGSARGHRLNKYHFNQQQQQQQQPGANVSAQAELEQQQQQQQQPSLVRVELRCSCQANPAASILWVASTNPNYVLDKGAPGHVLEEPRVEVNGHNSSSVLVIGYNLDPNWPFRRETYLCSASNKLGKATKSFTIEQGNPPPAFNVAPNKLYNPQTFQFRFTLLGPNFNPEASSSAGGIVEQLEIVPPVDVFRIRAESGPAGGGHSAAGAATTGHRQLDPPAAAVEPRTSYARRQLDPSVQWPIEGAGQLSSRSAPGNPGAMNPMEAQNVTINLGRLPSGNQRLFLEAHNAVGWSPNATYLGDFYLVSGASSSRSIAIGQAALCSLAIQLTVGLLFAWKLTEAGRHY